MARGKKAEGKALIQQVLSPNEGEKVYSGTRDERISQKGRFQKNFASEFANRKEDSMIDAIDMRRNMQRLVPLLDKFGEGRLDIQGFLSGVSGHLLRELLVIAFSAESEKNKLDALKHLLGIAGHSPTQKHAIERLDPATPKEALLSMIRGSKRDLEDEGIEVVEDDEAKPEGS